MKLSIKKIIHWQYLPFFTFAFLIAILHFSIELGGGDDLVYSEFLHQQSLWEFIKTAYTGWSSRIIIMPMASFFAGNNFILFSMVNISMYFLLSLMISKIIVYKKKEESNWIMVLLLLCVPFAGMMFSAGWIVTSIHYLWPLVMGLVALYPIKKVYCQQPIKRWELIFYVLATLFAANMEIMAAILVGFYGIFSVYFIIEKKIKGVIILETIISVGSLIFILTCPGNGVRDLMEISKNFPEYAGLGIFDKLSLSATSCFISIGIDSNFILLILSLMMLMFGCFQFRRPLMRILMGLPFLFAVIISFSRFLLLDNRFAGLFVKLTGVPKFILTTIEKSLGGMPGAGNYGLMLFMTLFILVFLMSSWFLFNALNKKIFVFLLLSSGIMTRIIMGFSPTVYISSSRTFLFQYITFVICGVLIYQEFIEMPVLKKEFDFILCSVAGVSYLESILLVF